MSVIFNTGSTTVLFPLFFIVPLKIYKSSFEQNEVLERYVLQLQLIAHSLCGSSWQFIGDFTVWFLFGQSNTSRLLMCIASDTEPHANLSSAQDMHFRPDILKQRIPRVVAILTQGFTSNVDYDMTIPVDEYGQFLRAVTSPRPMSRMCSPVGRSYTLGVMLDSVSECTILACGTWRYFTSRGSSHDSPLLVPSSGPIDDSPWISCNVI
jgi:hypothetical protein